MTSTPVFSDDEGGIVDPAVPETIYHYDVDGTATRTARLGRIDPARDPAIQENVDDDDAEGAFCADAQGAYTMTTPVVFDIIRPLTTPFPEPVARRLADYNRQIQALIDTRLVYLRGVLDMLGVDESASVTIDLDTYSYRVPDRDEPR